MKKTIKISVALIALSFAANASAIPVQVPDSWYDNMLFRIGVMVGNPGFCRAHPQAWAC